MKYPFWKIVTALLVSLCALRVLTNNPNLFEVLVALLALAYLVGDWLTFQARAKRAKEISATPVESFDDWVKHQQKGE